MSSPSSAPTSAPLIRVKERGRTIAKLSLASDDLYRDIHPASWFLIARSRALKPGGRLAVDAFGQRLVVWRDHSGMPHAQQRFCPHMGASLACGDVEGDRIVCP